MSRDPSTASISATGLVHGYGKGAARTPVLHQLSLQFWPGELTLMMGASGSGKSTLLAILSGLLRPESGAVRVLDTPLWNLGARELERFRFRHCGYVFQNFNLFPALTAIEQVALPLDFGGVHKTQARQRAVIALEEVGLGTRMNLRPAQLSGGEKQRVAIARALIGSPQILFADEPTSALDSANSEIVIALLQKIARTHGATVITVTHDPRLTRHAERIIRLQDGMVIEDTLEAPRPGPLLAGAAPAAGHAPPAQPHPNSTGDFL
ncbi:ABC transporter ATP-binding protein [Nevskia soli]|uniref:ABC transporter ATP-binding protein n=1 Tax=Nevskia soli TaxID=418856 RepID=UPI000A00DFD6|nr:ABC transporter ATP-binding protein [Nevskia soli]